jgi:flagellin-like protein
MNYKRMLKNSKAISPIFATLILIAIAVIAGVVVYMFTSGTLATMTAGGTAGQEKITVQAVTLSKGSGTIVYLEQTGGPAATINNIVYKDSTGNIVATVSGLVPSASPTASPSATLAPLSLGALTTISGVTPAAITVGTSYTITVTTAAGGSFVSPSVVATS